MWNAPDKLPAVRSIFLIRKWVATVPDGVLSFIAKNPDEHIRSIPLDLQFEPTVAVTIGYVLNGEFFDEAGDMDDSFNVDAILAWTPIPTQFMAETETDTAREASLAAISKAAGRCRLG